MEDVLVGGDVVRGCPVGGGRGGTRSPLPKYWTRDDCKTRSSKRHHCRDGTHNTPRLVGVSRGGWSTVLVGEDVTLLVVVEPWAGPQGPPS